MNWNCCTWQTQYIYKCTRNVYNLHNCQKFLVQYLEKNMNKTWITKVFDSNLVHTDRKGRGVFVLFPKIHLWSETFEVLDDRVNPIPCEQLKKLTTLETFQLPLLKNKTRCNTHLENRESFARSQNYVRLIWDFSIIICT